MLFMMRLLFVIFIALSFSGCSKEFRAAMSKYQTNFIFIDGLQRNLRIMYSDCDYEVECFEDDANDYIFDYICTTEQYENYGFISLKECDRLCYYVVDALIKGFQEIEKGP